MLKEAVATGLRWTTENASQASEQQDTLSTEDNVELLSKVSVESKVLGRCQQALLLASPKDLAQTEWNSRNVEISSLL